MSDAIGVAIVGCGAIGGVHARIVSDLGGAELVALVDVRTDAAAALADSLLLVGDARPRICATVEEAVAIPEVELVVLTTPSGLHASQASVVLEAKRHLLVEKPLDTDLGRARALAEQAAAARGAGVVASVVSQHRFDAGSVIVNDALARGDLGTLTSATTSTAWWRSQGYYDSAQWRGTRLVDGGGALMNQSIHMVDLLLSFMGRPREVFGFSALTAHDRIDVEDSAAAAIVFENGAVATLHATTAAYPGLTTRIQVMGSRGSAILEDDELTYFHSADPAATADVGAMGLTLVGGNQASAVWKREVAPTTPAAHYRLDPSSHRAQYVDLLRAISEDRAPRVTMQDAVDALGLITSVYVSGALHRPVTFDDVLAGAYDDVDLALG